MRLIDAEALIDELENDRPLNWTDSDGELQEQLDWDRFIGMVNVANTIKAAPVVFCCECKHFGKNEENDTYCSSVNGLSDPEENDFCSYGERRC